MVRFFINSAAVSGYLLLSACFLVSDNEISTRIVNALPSVVHIQIGQIDKRLTCIAATFTFLGSFENASGSAQDDTSETSGIGQIWHSSTSFSEYVETVEQGARRSTVEGTIVHARPCMENVNFDTNQLYDRPVIVTRSNSGKEVLIIFDQSEPSFGIYLAQGR